MRVKYNLYRFQGKTGYFFSIKLYYIDQRCWQTIQPDWIERIDCGSLGENISDWIQLLLIESQSISSVLHNMLWTYNSIRKSLKKHIKTRMFHQTIVYPVSERAICVCVWCVICGVCGVCMGCVWGVCGVCVGCVWCVGCVEVECQFAVRESLVIQDRTKAAVLFVKKI